MEWGIISYSGERIGLQCSTEKNRCRALELCLHLLYCFALHLKPYFSLNIVWKGRLT